MDSLLDSNTYFSCWWCWHCFRKSRNDFARTKRNWNIGNSHVV